MKAKNLRAHGGKRFPGILTASAGIVTAVTGLIVALHQAGLFGGEDKQGLQPRVETESPHIDSAPTIPKLRQESSGKEAVTPSESIIEPIRPLAQPETPRRNLRPLICYHPRMVGKCYWLPAMTGFQPSTARRRNTNSQSRRRGCLRLQE